MRNKEIDHEYMKQLSEATEIINLRFEQEAQARFAFEQKFKSMVNQRFEMLKNDLSKEVQMRNTSIANLEQGFENDFGKIEAEIKDTANSAEQTDSELNKIFDDLLDRVNEEKDQIMKEKDATEAAILDQLKQVSRIKDEILEEKKDRESVEETLLGLLETTCSRIQTNTGSLESRLTSPQKV